MRACAVYAHFEKSVQKGRLSFMLETNLRIVDGGVDVRVPVRYARVEGSHLTTATLERACNLLGHRHQVAARPLPKCENELIVLSDRPIRALKIEDENATISIADAGREGAELQVTGALGAMVLPSLLERALIAPLPSSTNLWRLDSPRKWLEHDPFESRDGIEAYRRFEISAVLIEDVGVGISIDASTAFLASQTLDYYFANGISSEESKRRQDVFGRLTSRQKGQKGTLVYRVGSTIRVFPRRFRASRNVI